MALAAVNLLCHHFSRTRSEKKGIKYLYILFPQRFFYSVLSLRDILREDTEEFHSAFVINGRRNILCTPQVCTVVDYIELVDIAGAKWSVRAFFLVQVLSPNGRRRKEMRVLRNVRKEELLDDLPYSKNGSPPLYGLKGNVILPEESNSSVAVPPRSIFTGLSSEYLRHPHS